MLAVVCRFSFLVTEPIPRASAHAISGRARPPLLLALGALLLGGCGTDAPRSASTPASAPGTTATRAAPHVRAPRRAFARNRPRPHHRAKAVHRARCTAPPRRERTITRPRWLSGVQVTEYYPVPERWFSGRRVTAPGAPGRHRVDWLYSARGVAMQGDGIDLRGEHVHVDELGSAGWVNRRGRHTRYGRCATSWSHGPPYWLTGGWRAARGAVTFPLRSGGWSAGLPRRQEDYRGLTFAGGRSRPLRYYRSIAVDPQLIPQGSRVFIPAYRHHGGGWFTAEDTGGAIRGRHVDVYRPPPARASDLGRYLPHARIFVRPPPPG